MAVIEYMLLRDNGSHQRFTPGFVKDRGYLQSPIDNSLIGWVEDDRDFYVPDTIVTLTKEEFVQRQLAIHAKFPIQGTVEEESGEADILTEDEVRAGAEEWYDNFVFKNTTEDEQVDAAPYPSGPSDTI